MTLIGALIGWIVARSRFWGRKILDVLSFMSLGIPAVIAALATMVLYLSVPIGLYGTVWMLVLAYSYRLATATRISRASLMQIHRELEEAAETSGATWLMTQVRIVVPLLSPALLASFLLIFIVGLREFTIPFVLASQDNLVLSVLIWQLFQNGKPDCLGCARRADDRDGAADDRAGAARRPSCGSGVNMVAGATTPAVILRCERSEPRRITRYSRAANTLGNVAPGRPSRLGARAPSTSG